MILKKIEMRVHSVIDGLTNAEKKVAHYFLENMESIFSKPIAQLARECGVSQVAWVRFCKSLGFEGLKDLKKSLFIELNEKSVEDTMEEEPIFRDIKDYSHTDQIIQAIKSSEIQAIEDTIRLLDPEGLETIAEQMICAESIKIIAVGASAVVAEDLFNKLLRIGKNVCFSKDNHMQMTYASNLTPLDLAIFISNSGMTIEVLEALEIAKKRGCSTVAITKLCKSPLAIGAEQVLYTSSPETNRRSGAMSSRIAQLTIVDILFTTMANKDYNNIEGQLERSYQTCLRHSTKV